MKMVLEYISSINLPLRSPDVFLSWDLEFFPVHFLHFLQLYLQAKSCYGKSHVLIAHVSESDCSRKRFLSADWPEQRTKISATMLDLQAQIQDGIYLIKLLRL